MSFQAVLRGAALALLALLSACQSLMDYQDSLYVRGSGATLQGPDYPWCPASHYLYPETGVKISFVLLAATPQGGACGPKTETTDLRRGTPGFHIEMFMDYGPRGGAAVGYLLGALSNRSQQAMAWPADPVLQVMEAKPPISKSDEKYIYPVDKVIEDGDLTINGMAWRHRYAYEYDPYNDGNGSINNIYEVYVHKLVSGQLIYVKADYDPRVIMDPAWITARRKVLRDMVGFIHIDPIQVEAGPHKP